MHNLTEPAAAWGAVPVPDDVTDEVTSEAAGANQGPIVEAVISLQARTGWLRDFWSGARAGKQVSIDLTATEGAAPSPALAAGDALRVIGARNGGGTVTSSFRYNGGTGFYFNLTQSYYASYTTGGFSLTGPLGTAVLLNHTMTCTSGPDQGRYSGTGVVVDSTGAYATLASDGCDVYAAAPAPHDVKVSASAVIFGGVHAANAVNSDPGAALDIDMLIRAWGQFRVANAAPSPICGRGYAAAISGTGVAVTFSSARASANYLVLPWAQNDAGGTAPAHVIITNQTTTGFQATVYSATGTLIDLSGGGTAVWLSFIVMGR